MPTNVNDKIKTLRPAQRKKVEVRAAQLIAEEMPLRELRRARKLTQTRTGASKRSRIDLRPSWPFASSSGMSP